MEEVHQDAAETTVEEASEENGGRQDRTWFPYITKVQFERFLSRLEDKIPDQINRDYVRPIIRTPSMIHRFLRGIESMNLTDRNQKPTDLLLRLVPQETRRFAVAEIVRDLYKELLSEWEQTDGNMSDDAIVDYFRNRTGMGRDSANKMKMFFKYLIAEADFGTPSAPQREAAVAEAGPQNERLAATAPQEDRSAREPAPAPKERPGRDGRAKRTNSERPERSQQDRPLTETQRAYLETLQSTLQINIDGDWDEDMIRLVFDRLERLFDRLRRA